MLGPLRYGDLVGTNETEYVVMLLAMLAGSTCFCYVLGNVFQMMESWDLPSAEHAAQMGAVQGFLDDRALPAALARRTTRHFKSAHQ